MAYNSSVAGSQELGKKNGLHRASRKQRVAVIRTLAIGGTFACIGLAAEMNLPDADALSILLPTGNGNATQISILEGNVFKPQLGLGGNGNSSNNKTVGDIMFGGGDPVTKLLDKQIVLGGASGTGNVTQISILSYNIINPQVALNGNNVSNNTTVSNVSAGMGNGAETTSTGSDTGTTLIGSAVGAGNATQISLFSGNIFNPQISLFGSNLSNNLAVTNVAAGNGNGADTTVSSGGGLFGTNLLGGVAGNGNTLQVASGSTNIINPQWSLLGTNKSNNSSYANQSIWNGNFSSTSVSGGGLLGASLFGTTGNGNNDQWASLVSNILNPQWSVGGGNLSNNTANTNNVDTTGNFSDTDVSSEDDGNNTVAGSTGNGINNQNGFGNGNINNNQLNLGNEAVLGGLTGGGDQTQQGQQTLLTQLGQQSKQSGASTPSAGQRPLSTLVKKVKDAVNKTLGIKPSDASPDKPADNDGDSDG